MLWGGMPGLHNMITNMYRSITTFSLLPLALFVLMGEVIAHSGMAYRMIDSLDLLFGKITARLSLLAVAGGVVLGALSGSTPGAAAILGESIAPEMKKRGYKNPLIIGPIIGSAGLAIIIPPSGMCVFLATMANISVSKLLIAGIIPGFLMAITYCIYIIIISIKHPEYAPIYEKKNVNKTFIFKNMIKNILPLSIIVFAVTGFILIGFTTPSEAAAWGVAASLAVAGCYKGINWPMLKKTMVGTLNISAMMFMIFLGAIGFSQLLAFSGATQALVNFATNLPVPPLFIIIIMQIVILFLGMFIEQASIMMITLPIYMPIVNAFGFNNIWFGMITLICLGIANRTPPFGFLLFVLKAVLPEETRMGEIYRSAMPYVFCDLAVVALLMIIPSLAYWLPEIIR